MQQPDPFRPKLEVHRANAGDVAAGTIKAFDKPASQGIGARRKDNRNRCRHFFGCAHGRQRVERDDDRRPVLHGVRAMSALPPKADITAAQTNVRFVPILLQKTVEGVLGQ